MLLATLAAIFIKTGNRLVLPAVFGAVMAVLIILNYREIRKTATLIVADDKLEYESEVLRPEDIERIELRARAMFIRRKTGGWTTLGLALKDREEFERLIPRMRGNLFPILAGAGVIFVLAELSSWLLGFPVYLLIELFQPGLYWLGDTLLDLWVDVTNVLFLVFGLQLYMRITGSQAGDSEPAAAKPEDMPADARVAQAAPSLETQIQDLRAMGITFNLPDEVLIGKLTAQCEPRRYEEEPYTLLLDVAGTDLVDEDGSVLRMSDDVLSFDLECVEEPDIYATVVRRFVQLTRGEVRIDELESRVDFDEGKAWLSFTHEGKRHELDVKFDDDWFDVSVFDRIAAIMKRPGKRFVRSVHGQNITLLYCTPETLHSLNRATGNRFQAIV
jgi:hypothetical protein